MTETESAGVSPGIGGQPTTPTLHIGDGVEDGTFTGSLWQSNKRIYEAIMEHPFLEGLVDGSLPQECFRLFALQDWHYLRSYCRSLAVLASRAPEVSQALRLLQGAVRVTVMEGELQRRLLEELGVDETAVRDFEGNPTSVGYSNFVVAATATGSFAEGLAAVLPCYWIYGEVGHELARRGSRNNQYQKWIESYAAEEFQDAVLGALRMVEEAGKGATSEERVRMQAAFRRGCRYEWMFWDAAWRLERWPAVHGEGQ